MRQVAQVAGERQGRNILEWQRAAAPADVGCTGVDWPLP
jgi:hypothetical protein